MLHTQECVSSDFATVSERRSRILTCPGTEASMEPLLRTVSKLGAWNAAADRCNREPSIVEAES